ncbi:murein transglycosylase [Massilia sp. Root133]|uniref:lytic murein transglycosylase B n=1 Tax=unclassified Massilia TaxID=2609279 RepID=UPI000701C56D|nr:MULTISPECIES: lytic murein transglycosylase B [unclassified Massilia]KQY08476.1 murein transglycosylase [Massilia sp. Root133]KQZ42302.1 murein transglycosylase [Massilia sp. Root1485]
MKSFASLLLALAIGAGPAADALAASSLHHTKATAKSAKAAKAAKKAGKKAQAAAPARPAIDYDGEAVNFSDWQAVRDFEDDIVARNGFERAQVEDVIKRARFIDSAVQLVKPAPPGKPKNWQAYSDRFIEPIRINAGVRFWNENADLLARAEATYGVPAEIIVGILGVETIYGRDTGRFRVVDVLTTLAFAYPETPNRADRMAFFRGELENTLLLAHKENIDPFSLLGSFAGAVGMPQFMPGNILKYGVDFDGDGIVDLRGSAADAIGSVANFLVEHGWDRNNTGPAVFPANVAPSLAWQGLLGGLEARYRPGELDGAGVATRTALPDGRLYGLVDLQNGADPTEYWVANANFFAITKYNRSYFYAMSVVELGRAVRLARGI